jgi:hypothetical protein
MAHDKYTAPAFNLKAFTCPFCDVYSNFFWQPLKIQGHPEESGVRYAFCSHCQKPTVWMDAKHAMIWPQDVSAAPLPNPDMPADIQKDYTEARSICGKSARGAAALLRLSIQKLCKQLGESGENINADIGNLVKKGLPIQIQQALDIVRVTGNNAVHPGEMQLQEDLKTVALLFQLVNLIVENQISQPKAVQELYSTLPQGAVEAIKKRDGNANN